MILHHRRPCCGGPVRLAGAAGDVLRRRCATCRITWTIRLEPAHPHLRSATGRPDLLAARWQRADREATR